MSDFREFNSRFISSCKSCGAVIPQGDKCYGTKNSSGKWLIACEKCYKDGSYKKLTTPDLPIESLGDVISKAKEIEDRALHVSAPSVGKSSKPRSRKSSVTADGREIDDDSDLVSPLPSVVLSEDEILKSLSFEDRIKRTAKWYIS